MKNAADKDEFLTSLLEAYLPVSILLIIINLLYFALKVFVRCSLDRRFLRDDESSRW